MRFKLDENLPVGLAQLLRQAGHDALTTIDQQLGGATDLDLATICQQEQRTILTLDTDFLNVREYPPEQYCGIIVMRLRRQGIPSIQRAVARLLSSLIDTSLDGKLCVVSESRIRFRTAIGDRTR